MKIGLIGCGSIGQFLLEKINGEKVLPGYEITGIFDERATAVEKLKNLVTKYEVTHARKMDLFLQGQVDLVIECANIQSVKDYAKQIVQQKDLLVISIGAFADSSFYKRLIAVTEESGRKVYLPTGAIGGLDLVKAANIMGGLKSVTLTSRKPLTALSDELLTTETTLFKGTAKEAIERFPKNANVAIALSLAGIGVEKTNVQMIADPNITRNIHTIQLEGDFGKAEVMIENRPSPTNEKTSYLTALSILSAMQSLQENIIIG